MPYAKIVNGAIVYPPHNDGNRINVHLDSEWLSANGYTDMTEEEIAQYAASAISVQAIFTKLQIRRAMRALEMEPILDAILASNVTFAADWADAQEIDLSDPVFASAIAAAGITEEQIAAVKTKILEG